MNKTVKLFIAIILAMISAFLIYSYGGFAPSYGGGGGGSSTSKPITPGTSDRTPIDPADIIDYVGTYHPNRDNYEDIILQSDGTVLYLDEVGYLEVVVSSQYPRADYVVKGFSANHEKLGFALLFFDCEEQAFFSAGQLGRTTFIR